MKTFTFKTGKAGSITDHVQEFMLALLLAGRIINRHFVHPQKSRAGLIYRKKFLKPDFIPEI